jgi:hypothetical protein
MSGFSGKWGELVINANTPWEPHWSGVLKRKELVVAPKQ